MRLDQFEASVNFDSEDHTYRRKKDGKIYVSCTKIVETLPKDFLTRWASKANYLYVMKAWDPMRTYTQEEKWKILGDALVEFKRIQNDSTKIGRTVHKWLENHIRGNATTVMPVGFERPLREFLKWEDENVQEWIASEKIVSSDEYEYAGTLDAIAQLKNQSRAIIDFKTSDALYESYNLQTAGYLKALEEMGILIDQRKLIRIPKSEMHEVFDKASWSHKVVENKFEVKTVMSDVEKDFETFLHLKAVHEWMEQNK